MTYQDRPERYRKPPIERMPCQSFRIQLAALSLARKPLPSARMFPELRRRYGLTAAEALKAKEIAFELDALWPR